jgi:hypothetical protein
MTDRDKMANELEVLAGLIGSSYHSDWPELVRAAAKIIRPDPPQPEGQAVRLAVGIKGTQKAAYFSESGFGDQDALDACAGDVGYPLDHASIVVAVIQPIKIPVVEGRVEP